MSSSKGYPTQEKDDRLKAQFATVEPVREKQFGLSVNAAVYVYSVGTDAVEANSTTYVVNATAHAARVGDVIRFTSGTHSGREVKVHAVETNSFTIAETLSSAPAAADTFQILRPKYPVVGADGSLSVTTSAAPIQYVLDGVDTEVMKDTVTPANSRPLPVELMGTSGPINITAGDLNVSLSHVNDSVKIGDGTETANVNASNELQVADDTARSTLSTINGKIPALGQAAMAASSPVVIASDQSAVPVADGGGSLTVDGTVAATQSGVWNITNVSGTVSLPTGAATEVSLAIVAGDTTSLDAKVPAQGQALMAASLPVAIASDQSAVPVSDAGGSLTVDGTVAATQSGAWSVSVSSSALPTGAATLAEQQTQTTSLQLLDDAVATTGAAIPGKGIAVSGTDGTNAKVLKTDANGELQVDILSQPALASGTDSVSAVQSGAWTVAATDGGGSLTVDGTVAASNFPATVSTNSGASDASTIRAILATNQPVIPINDNGGSLTIDGAVSQSGTWDIEDITGTVSLPTGASTLAEQQTQTTSLQLLDDAVATTGAAITAKGIAAVGTDGTNARILKTDASGELQVDVLSIPAPTYLDVVDFIDTTPVLDTSSTNIAGSGSNPTQVVASLAANVKKVQFLDTTGAFIGLYTGAALSEVLQAVFGPGSDQTVEVQLTSGDRVSLKRLDSVTAISSGIVSINFIG